MSRHSKGYRNPESTAQHVLLCASVSLFSASPVWADTATDNTGSLPAVTVVERKAGSANAPTVSEARANIEQIPGGVALVPETAWKETQAATIKDILDYTPGVFAQPKWGDDTRLSIRGSGLSRYYHLRGILLYQDGVPLNSADGSSDFHAIDPSAYRYTEVYKGANGLRYGASALGGAINFVTPTGKDADAFNLRLDAGSFGWRRFKASGGFANDTVDGFITGAVQQQDGFRDHSNGQSGRVSGNLGFKLADNIETRFYLSAADSRQHIPGSVSRDQALTNPRQAAAGNLSGDWQRNIDSTRLSNRTTIVAGDTVYELGGWLAQSHLKHPIYQYLDNKYDDAGIYARLNNTSTLAGHGNRFTLGLTISEGKINASNSVNAGGNKLGLLSATRDKASNTLVYAENTFDLVPELVLVTGIQYMNARRQRIDEYNYGGLLSRSGEKTYDFFNPKVGLIWKLNAQTQVFANVSRSAEPPSFDDMNFSTANDLNRLQPQRATTIEIGARGTQKALEWEVSAYRAKITNQFQCISSMFNICDQTVNIANSIHQGIEAGLHWTFLQGVFDGAGRTDRLLLNASYTFSDFRFDHDPLWGNNRIPGVPRQYLRAELLYRNAHGFYIGPNVEWVPSGYFVDNANTAIAKTTSYALLGLRTGWESGRTTVFLEGRNLGNRKYISSASVTDVATATSTLYEPGSGRALNVGVEWRY